MQSASRSELTWTGLDELRPVLEAYLSAHSRDDSEIEDVIQETLMRAARYRGSLDSAASLRGWVLQIALNVLRDRARRELRLPRIEADELLFESLEGREAIPGDVSDDMRVVLSGTVVEKRSALDHLRRALRQLDPGERRVLETWYGTELDCDRAALVCECEPELVRVRAWRARRRLTRILCCHLVLDASIDWPPHLRSGSWLEDSLGAQCALARKAVKRRATSAAG